MRLDAFIASFGLGSRREAGEMIRAGRVTVAGTVARSASVHVKPGEDAVACDGAALCWRDGFCIMMNKPAGLLSATEDPKQRTVLDLLEPVHRARGVFPAGRLDKDAIGLLLLTDDGTLAHRLLSPGRGVSKRYEVWLEAPMNARAQQKAMQAFAAGVALSDFTALPAQLDWLGGDHAVARVCEGKFHQVKRMFEAVGGQVRMLKRLSIGGLMLDEALPPGAYRDLTAEELAGLRKEAGL